MFSSIFCRSLRHEERLARTMVLTSLGTYLSWGPYFVAMFVSAARPISPDVAAFTALVASLSTIYNPIFYVILNRNFRTSVLRSLPFRGASQVGDVPTDDGIVSTVSRGAVAPDNNKNSPKNTTWRPSLQIQQTLHIGAAPDGLDTIMEVSTPAPSPAFNSDKSFSRKFSKENDQIPRQVSASTQTDIRKTKIQRQILSAKSFTVQVELDPLPAIDV